MRRPIRSSLPNRRGSAAVDVVLTLGVTFPIAVAFYWLAQTACGNLHDLLSAIAGSPYF